MSRPKHKLAIVVSHPIQHFVSFYRSIAEEPDIELKVFYMSDFSVRGYFDQEMGAEVAWKMDLLSSYDHEFLPEAKSINRSSPLTLNNPSVTGRLAAFDPDVVLTYGYNQITQMRVLFWCRGRGVPVMMLSDSELQQERSSWKQTAKATLLPRILRRYSAFLTVGDNNETYMRSFGVPQERLFRSPFTIDEKTYLDARANKERLSQEFRGAHGIDQNETVFLSVGKLSPRKRPLDIVGAARLLKQEQPDLAIRFMLAGSGSLLDEIKAAVEAEALPVTTLGFVNVDVLPQVYAAADAIVHPAEADPHPLVMSEAACIGLPLVVSDKVGAIGPTDIARPGENTIVTPCGDVRAIADAAVQITRDGELRSRLSEGSIRTFSDLDMERSVAGLKDAIQHCLAQSGAKAVVSAAAV